MKREIERLIVRSKSVATVGYDPVAKVLAVEYFNGMVYHFFGVPPDLGEKLRLGHRFDELFRVVPAQYEYRFVRELPPVFLG